MRVYFARAMESLGADAIVRLDDTLRDRLDPLGMTLANPYDGDDARRGRISGVCEIVEQDLWTLRDSDLVVADLSIPGRSYVGAMMEIRAAYDLGKPVYAFVGKSGNADRMWLQYHASAICITLRDVIELLEVNYTDMGRMRDKKATLAYYADIAAAYERNFGEGQLFPGERYREAFEQYRRERHIMDEWVEGLRIQGTVLDLGCGTGRLTASWAPSARRVIGVDAADGMLTVARERWSRESVEFLHGDITDSAWLKELMAANSPIETIVLSAILGSLTPTEEERLLNTLMQMVPRGCQLVVLENQHSLFSERRGFSRIEMQNRRSMSGERIYRLHRRNFLIVDLRRMLQPWGHIDSLFHTDNFFVAGVAQRSIGVCNAQNNDHPVL